MEKSARFLTGLRPGFQGLPAPAEPPPNTRAPARETLPKVRRSLRPDLPDPYSPEAAGRLLLIGDYYLVPGVALSLIFLLFR